MTVAGICEHLFMTHMPQLYRPNPRPVVKGLAPDDPAIIASRLLMLGGVLRRGLEDACAANPVPAERADAAVPPMLRSVGVLNNVATIQDPQRIDADRIRLLLIFLEQVNMRDTITVGRVALLLGCSPSTASRITREAHQEGILMVPRTGRGYQLSQMGRYQLQSVVGFVREVAVMELGAEAIVDDAQGLKDALWCATAARFRPRIRNAKRRKLRAVA